ncbi:hypothetical protein Lalb_Chr10g0106141 [Lupinus albus]|uniref:Uncharacterized protein n=1 Tax=Lupinus albus TaxID=3870 RepID=A0A6A4PXV8_LUPAL|nr:hypothetical protein Lalb_Chr10g0106141 [Lupinus albus]
MDISFSNELGYMSALTCPSQDMCFYSAPTSPSRLKLCAPSGFQSGNTTPRTYYDDVKSNLDEFEFETSRRFNYLGDLFFNETSQRNEDTFYHQQDQQNMAFADDLFCDGKVLPLIPPLKLPPRLLQNGDGSMMSTQSSALTSPRSPGSMLRFPFLRLTSRNDDFDPFMAALENVREEKWGETKAKHGLRRTRSLSPFRGFNYKPNKHKGLPQSNQSGSHCFGPSQLKCELQKEPLKLASGITSMLSEPKGLVFARQVRLVGVCNDAKLETKKTSASKLAKETEKGESERGGFWAWKNKKENIMKFLFGNAYKGKTHAKTELEDKKAASEKPDYMRKLDMKSVKLTQSTQWDKKKKNLR